MSRFELIGNTKIICTIGPASQSPERLQALIEAGMDVARLNFSHGSREEHHGWIERIRSASTLAGEPIAILQDLSGPKIRTGTVAGGAVELVDGRSFTFTTDAVQGTADRVSTTYEALPRDVRPGNTILVDDGRMKFVVTDVRGSDVRCVVEHGGLLKDKKGMNLPGVRVSAASLTAKDREDLAFGLEHGVDYVALSFVRTAEDVVELKRTIERTTTRRVPVIAKIERQEAVEHFDEILGVVDAVMVARGDLGVELPPEEVPIIQKRIVRRCNTEGIPVIIATQMLESMIEQPRPTRAEASDVANAVIDGADAVMLSGETSVGRFPIEAVQVMDQIIRRSESEATRGRSPAWDAVSVSHQRSDAIARAACVLADEIGARAIVAMTHTGGTVLSVSKYRPHARIVAVTDQADVLRQLNLVWGVRGMLMSDLVKDSDEAFRMVREELKRSGYVNAGDQVVFTAGLPFWTRGATNSVKVEVVE